jgi:serine/threonine-protein phosphatase 2B catalytic subunit
MEYLKDPCNDRSVKDLPPPPALQLTKELLYTKKGVPDIAILQEHLHREGRVAEGTLLDVIKDVSAIFASEPNMLKVKDPITVVGDIHGQYYDFVKMLEVGGPPGDTQYIFLGDFVDRGSYSIEVLALIFAIKIKFPKRIWMLRGNHECRQMTAFFNFRDECEHKYNAGVYDAIMDCFDNLPLAATINGKFLAVHGGISPDLKKLKDLNSVDRFHEPPREGIQCDLIWADPMEDKEGQPPKKGGETYIPNEVRGCSYFFTFDAAVQFLQKNSLLSVIRAHEAQVEGYKMHKTNPATGFPSVITIFSAPNYCDCYNNKAAILKFDNNTLNILQFNCSPHPYHLPNFMDVFTWSMPFVIEKVTEMLYFILQPTSETEFEDDASLGDLPPAMQKLFRNSMSADEKDAVELAAKLAQHMESGAKRNSTGGGDGHKISAARADHLRKKVKTVARMARMFKTLRQENETVIRLKGVCPGHKLAPGLLLAGKEAMVGELDQFNAVQGLDCENEKRPDMQ